MTNQALLDREPTGEPIGITPEMISNAMSRAGFDDGSHDLTDEFDPRVLAQAAGHFDGVSSAHLGDETMTVLDHDALAKLTQDERISSDQLGLGAVADVLAKKGRSGRNKLASWATGLGISLGSFMGFGATNEVFADETCGFGATYVLLDPNHPEYGGRCIDDEPTPDPPATDPPATNPPATDPPATNPPATNPPATNPPATNPQRPTTTQPQPPTDTAPAQTTIPAEAVLEEPISDAHGRIGFALITTDSNNGKTVIEHPNKATVFQVA